MKRLLALLLIIIACMATGRAQVVVIVHPSVPGTTIDNESLIDIYMLTKTKWADDTPVRVFTLKKGSALVERFYSHLGLNTLTLNKQWLRIQLTGEGRAPTAITEEEVVEHVAATPGAIGFVDVSRVTDKVKVLRQVGQ
jgi:ABC-type phosphate transport system substrate-binding protein